MDFQNILVPAAAIGGIGLLFGLGLSFASKMFAVEVDKRVDMVREVLPGANCGACGQSGCDSFAEAVVEGKVSVGGCPVGGTELAQKLSEIMGVSADMTEPMTARVMCNGNLGVSKIKYDYSGMEDCIAAANLYGGPMACSYGCIGLGSCVKECPFDAIYLENGLAKVNESKCTSCGKCVAICPKNIIKMVPRSSQYAVLCTSLDKGVVVKQSCDVGCIGCRKCGKVCPEDAIIFKGTLAEIDQVKCTNCGKCIDECPTGSIVRMIRNTD